MRKTIIALSCILASAKVFAFTDPKIGGMITISKEMESRLTKDGNLYVLVREIKPDFVMNEKTPPLAVFKIDRPKFPQAFVVTQKNVVIPGKPFKGPFSVIARYSPVGDGTFRNGSIEGFDKKFPAVDLGNKNLNIELNIPLDRP